MLSFISEWRGEDGAGVKESIAPLSWADDKCLCPSSSKLVPVTERADRGLRLAGFWVNDVKGSAGMMMVGFVGGGGG